MRVFFSFPYKGSPEGRSGSSVCPQVRNGGAGAVLPARGVAGVRIGSLGPAKSAELVCIRPLTSVLLLTYMHVGLYLFGSRCASGLVLAFCILQQLTVTLPNPGCWWNRPCQGQSETMHS